MKHLFTICTFLLPVVLFASTSPYAPLHNCRSADGSETVQAPVCYPPYPAVTGNLDVIGDTATVGTTWYENQHNGTIGRMIEKSDDGYLHLVWTNGLDIWATDRHVYYNAIDPGGSQLWPMVGYAVESAMRGGYATLDVDHGGKAFPAFHEIIATSQYAHTAVGAEFFPHTGAFFIDEPDWLFISGIDQEVIWPKIMFDLNQRAHIMSCANPTTGVFVPRCQYYTYGEYNSSSFQMEFPEDPDTWTEVGWTMTYAGDVAASEVSDRIAFGWTFCRDEGFPVQGNFSQYNNDIYLLVDDDGLDPQFNQAINLTNFIPPDLSWLPDTLAANRDTLRAYDDMCLFFDQDDVLHVAFTTLAYFEVQGVTYWHPSIIWHWSEEYPGEFRMIHNAFDDFTWNFTDCGEWNVKAQRPSLGQDPETGFLYCAYQVYDCDTTALSSFGWPSGEVYVSVSADGGMNWSVGTNITQTVSRPNAIPGECLSEIHPSMAKLVDGNCHILYVLDKDAGSVVLGEGTWTYNQMIYHQVDTDDIPLTPLVPQTVPFHVGYQPGLVSGLPSLLTFNNVPVDPLDIPTADLFISYSGDDSVFVSSIESSDPDLTTDFPPEGVWLSSFETFDVEVTFDPDELGLFEAELTVRTTLNSPVVQVRSTVIQPFLMEMTLLSSPSLPSYGGTVEFEIAVDNLSAEAFTLEGWLNLEMPNGLQFTAIGPVNISLEGGGSNVWLRQQTVPANALPGTYWMYGMMGEHPWQVDLIDTLTFYKSGTDCEGEFVFDPSQWINTGDPFEEVGSSSSTASIPQTFAVYQNYPNPFNPATTIAFDLPAAGLVAFDVFDVNGRNVTSHQLPAASRHYSAGHHTITFDGSGLSSGIYLYRLSSGQYSGTGKMVLMK